VNIAKATSRQQINPPAPAKTNLWRGYFVPKGRVFNGCRAIYCLATRQSKYAVYVRMRCRASLQYLTLCRDVRQRVRRNKFATCGIILLLLLAACTATDAPAGSSYSTRQPESLVRRIATVYASPTPGAEAQRATQFASRPTQDVRIPTLQPSPTVYIGVFLGAEQSDGGLPVVDAAQYQGTLAAFAPTLEAGAISTVACTISADPIFGVRWAGDPQLVEALGCPIENVQANIGTTQVFENGAMYFIPSGDIWALRIAGATGGAYWHVAQAPPEQTWDVPVPEGLRLPSLGFGAVWRAVDGVRQTLGFARAEETAASLSTQRFEGGMLILDSSAGQVFVLIGEADSGTVYGPY
jgi:hypothetical protein